MLAPPSSVCLFQPLIDTDFLYSASILLGLALAAHVFAIKSGQRFAGEFLAKPAGLEIPAFGAFPVYAALA
jgi:hypothetical protein